MFKLEKKMLRHDEKDSLNIHDNKNPGIIKRKGVCKLYILKTMKHKSNKEME